MLCSLWSSLLADFSHLWSHHLLFLEPKVSQFWDPRNKSYFQKLLNWVDHIWSRTNGKAHTVMSPSAWILLDLKKKQLTQSKSACSRWHWQLCGLSRFLFYAVLMVGVNWSSGEQDAIEAIKKTRHLCRKAVLLCLKVGYIVKRKPQGFPLIWRILSASQYCENPICLMGICQHLPYVCWIDQILCFSHSEYHWLYSITPLTVNHVILCPENGMIAPVSW